MWSFNTTSSIWRKVNPSTVPQARYQHSAVKIANEEILYFGGWLESGSSTNEVLKFNPLFSTWTTLAPSPSPMDGHSPAFDPAGNQTIVYYDGDLYAYSVSTNVWRTITQGAVRPTARIYPSTSIETETREIFLFGGLSGTTYNNDIWKYNVTTNRWKNVVNTSSQTPIGRYAQYMIITSRDDLVVNGGHNGGTYLTIAPFYLLGVAFGDTWLFNLQTSKWSQLITLQSPSGRYLHGCDIDDQDNILMFGGQSGPYFDDLWKLQIYNDTLETTGSRVTQSSSTSFESPTSNSATASITASSQEEDVVLVVSKEVSLSSSTSKRPTPVADSTQNLFTATNISILTAISICVVLMIICLGYFCARNKSKSIVGNTGNPKEIQETFYGSTGDSSTTQSSTSTTMMLSNYGLSIPVYLLLRYGVSVRPKREIARGGFGKIMLGEAVDMQSLASSTPVIIKEMLSRKGELSQQEIDSFYQEVSIMAFLGENKNIATLYGYTETPYTIVMKYYPLGSLDTWIYSRQNAKTISQLFYFAFDIALGVEFMWLKGFCHADIKPQNILIDLDISSNIAFCVLTDFGITQVFSDKSLLVKAFKPVNINGASICYASPEALLKLRRKEYVPHEDLPKFDIYSYAIVLFELVCRRKPF